MTTEQELNEKLLKFAGWKKSFNDYQNGDWWRTPSGEITCELPNFLHSLDTCLEYLGPQFSEFNIYKISKGLRLYAVSIGYSTKIRGFADDDNLALAFCRATEQIIDNIDNKRENDR